MALLLATVPVGGKLLLGVWTFRGAVELACLCLIVGAYLHLLGRDRAPVIPDTADLLAKAIELASGGDLDAAIAVLTEAIRLSPRCWQAYEYRSALLLAQQNPAAALDDAAAAILLAPQEEHLYALRARARQLLESDALAP
jgi:tetratricopeptide (TPR) repeat protein